MALLDFLKTKKGWKGGRKKDAEEEEKKEEKTALEIPELKDVSPESYSGGVLINPSITEKSSLHAALNKYVFKVSIDSNKFEIKKAIERKYHVHVAGVAIVNIPSRKVRLGRITGRVPGFKKAVVTLEKGDKIDVGM